MNEPARPCGSICIITGLSGAGKSTALRVFEDLRFFAVDGLPAVLAPEIAAMMQRHSMCHFTGMAIGMDLHQDNFLAEFHAAVDRLVHAGFDIKIIFLEADDEALIRRYAATRRPHPLERNGLGLKGAIEEERKLLGPLREMAGVVINSTDFSIHDLRRSIQRLVLDGAGAKKLLRVNLVSFGFKYGIPQEADFVFDLRFLPNPYFVEELRPFTGHDSAVAEYVFRDETALEYRRKLVDFLLFVLAGAEAEGRYRVTVALGCTGGRHRSVAMTARIATELAASGYSITVEDRTLERDGSANAEREK